MWLVFWFLGGQGVEISLPGSVIVASEAVDLGVVDEPVDYGLGDGLVAEDFSAPSKGPNLETNSAASRHLKANNTRDDVSFMTICFG